LLLRGSLADSETGVETLSFSDDNNSSSNSNSNSSSNDLSYDEQEVDGPRSGGDQEYPSMKPVLSPGAIRGRGPASDDDREPIGDDAPHAEASNEAPANLLVVGVGSGAGGPADGGGAATAEEGRSLDLGRNVAGSGGNDRAAHRIIISQHLLRETDFDGEGNGGLTLEIGSQGSSGRVLDISNMVGIAVGALGFLLIVCGKQGAKFRFPTPPPPPASRQDALTLGEG
jgi:hypothetical protein